MQALLVEQRIEQLRVAFRLLDIEGMVYLHIPSKRTWDTRWFWSREK